jgi:hypothetical protein
MGLPEPYYRDEASTIYCGEALTLLAELPSASVQLIVIQRPIPFSDDALNGMQDRG